MPITNINHSAFYIVEMGVSARDLTRITLDNNHTAYMHICLQGIGYVCVKNYPPEMTQPSSSTCATIVSAEIKLMQPSSRPFFSFAIITSYGNQITEQMDNPLDISHVPRHTIKYISSHLYTQCRDIYAGDLAGVGVSRDVRHGISLSDE